MVSRNNNKYIMFLTAVVVNLISISTQDNYAQDIPASSSGELLFYLDQASFAGNDGYSVTEFYLMFYADQILNISKTTDNKSEIQINSVISSLDDDVIAKQSWITEINFDSNTDSSNSKVVYDQWKEELKSGDYKIKVEVFSKDQKKVATANKKFYVPNFSYDKNSVSDIQFITSVNAKNSSENFKKGNFKILPNPSRRYGVLIPDLYFYFELYGFDSTSGNLFADYQIEDKDLHVIKTIENVKITKQSKSDAVIHGINVSTLKTGVYTLKGTVKEEHSNDAIAFSKEFEIIQADFFENRLVLTDEQASIFETILSLIASPDQLTFYRSLSLQGKGQYIIQFWKNMDNDPSTNENNYLDEIQKRFQYAKNRFSSLGVNGWETDRGRICIKYGIPNQINQFSSEANTVPYEIWTYNDKRTYEFVFADLRSNGNYILLHSNREGEIYNNSWPEQIKKM